MIFGYARVSTASQKKDLQLDALIENGVEKGNIYSDIASGAKAERKGLDEVISKLRKGDTLMVWKMDRIARSLSHLVRLMEDFNLKGIHFKSIQEPFIDTTSSHGKFVFTLFAAVAQLERDMIIERTKAGLESSRRKGVKLGRKSGLGEDAKKKAILAESYYRENNLSVDAIMKIIGVSSKRTLYKYLAYQGRRNCVICKNIVWDKKQDVDSTYCAEHEHKIFKFIGANLKEDNPIGDLSRDILRDIALTKSFPTSSEKKILDYLETKTLMGGTHDVFLQLKHEYKKSK